MNTVTKKRLDVAKSNEQEEVKRGALQAICHTLNITFDAETARAYGQAVMESRWNDIPQPARQRALQNIKELRCLAGYLA